MFRQFCNAHEVHRRLSGGLEGWVKQRLASWICSSTEICDAEFGRCVAPVMENMAGDSVRMLNKGRDSIALVARSRCDSLCATQSNLILGPRELGGVCCDYCLGETKQQ